MKTVLLAFVLFVSVAASAATNTGTQADHDQLRQLLRTAQQAVNEDKPELLQAYLHPDSVVTLMNQDVVTEGKSIEEVFYEWFKQPDALLKSLRTAPEASIQTNIYGGQFGFCYGTSVDTYELNDGRQFQFTSHWTATVIKEGDEWQLLALHVGVNPIENPLIDSYRKGLGFGGVLIEIGRRLFN